MTLKTNGPPERPDFIDRAAAEANVKPIFEQSRNLLAILAFLAAGSFFNDGTWRVSLAWLLWAYGGVLLGILVVHNLSRFVTSREGKPRKAISWGIGIFGALVTGAVIGAMIAAQAHLG